jgi:hypothetical protein
MSHIIANLPTVKCFVRREFLYDFEKGHGDTDTVMYERKETKT